MKGVVLLLVTLGVALAMRHQSIAVKGRLKCGPKAAVKVRVKLWEEDGGKPLAVSGFSDAVDNTFQEGIIV